MKEKCYTCEQGNLARKLVEPKLYGIIIGKFKAKFCDRCGEIFYDKETFDKITELTKKKGLLGLQAKTKIGQSGSTLNIRLPKKIIDFLDLKKGSEVELLPEGKDKLVVSIKS